MELTPGTIVAGKFRLDYPLAQGGMGSVWVAFNTQLEVPVAVKFMAPSLVGSAELVARFEREAKAAAQLRNPHVVQIFEHGFDRGAPFMAMELLEGENLGARLRARKRLSTQETSRIVGDVCKALRRAHEMGLVHRDLKPANIFLCKHDEYEVVKVLDFGIVKSVAPGAQDEATKTGALVGSPHYMSPEQARRTNKQVDHRADLWALGVISFRCLTGRLPFPGDDMIDVLVRVCTEAVPLPSSIAGDLGPEIDRFFVRALARDPDQRFQSAREMADALARLAGTAARESLPSIDRSRSEVRPPPARIDLHIPPPRSSDAGATRAASHAPPPPPPPPPATDLFDGATTLPIAHPSAQRAVAGQAWAGAVHAAAGPYVPPATPEATEPLPAPPPPPAPAFLPPGPAFAPPAPDFIPPWSMQRAPFGSAPELVVPAPVMTKTTPLGPAYVVPDPTPHPQTDGTLTSAGAELSAPPTAPTARQDRSWIAAAAAVAALVVVGILVVTVLLARGPGDAAAGDPENDTSTGVAGAAPPSDPTTAAPSTAPPAADTGETTAAPAASDAPGDTGSGSAAEAPSSTPSPSDEPSLNDPSTPDPPQAGQPASSAAPGTAAGKGGPAPNKPPSGFLSGPAF